MLIMDLLVVHVDISLKVGLLVSHVFDILVNSGKRISLNNKRLTVLHLCFQRRGL